MYTFEDFISRSPVRTSWQLGLTLTAFQALDGLFTLRGVMQHGVEIEGNPILRSLMEHFGPLPALSLAKATAAALVIGLSCYACVQPWVRTGLAMLTCYYFFLAILPWSYVLFLAP